MAFWPFKSAIEKHVDSAIEEKIFEQVAREMHANTIWPELWAKHLLSAMAIWIELTRNTLFCAQLANSVYRNDYQRSPRATSAADKRYSFVGNID